MSSQMVAQANDIGADDWYFRQSSLMAAPCSCLGPFYRCFVMPGQRLVVCDF
jgi:hypothetical protein